MSRGVAFPSQIACLHRTGWVFDLVSGLFRSSKLAMRVCALVVWALLAADPAYSEERRGNNPEVGLPTLAPLIKRVSPAVVSIASTKHVAGDRQTIAPGEGFPDAPLPQDLNVGGSGVVVDANLGLIVTANHVIEDAETTTVALSDGLRVDARLLATSRNDDLAILRVAASGLTELALSDPNSLEVGDFVVAFGNPLGLGQSTTFGIVSALHRSCPGIKNADLIVIDALIDRGNSGGALINTRGELVGINVARLHHSSAAGFGFAVPASAVRALLARVRFHLG